MSKLKIHPLRIYGEDNTGAKVPTYQKARKLAKKIRKSVTEYHSGLTPDHT